MCCALCALLWFCRTDSSYARWEEALKTWNEVRSLSKDLARQVCGRNLHSSPVDTKKNAVCTVVLCRLQGPRVIFGHEAELKL
jgi:predicted membrane chloride channel (bestrophin family)